MASFARLKMQLEGLPEAENVLDALTKAKAALEVKFKAGQPNFIPGLRGFWMLIFLCFDLSGLESSG